MYVKCSQCKARHRVTDENVRIDGASIKCRNCDTVIYFKNPPPIRAKTKELSEPVSMPPDQVKTQEKKEYSKPVSLSAKQIRKEEKRELKMPVSIPDKRYRGAEHKDTIRKVPSPDGIKTKTSSQVHTLFEQILEKMESKRQESFYRKLPISSKDIETPTVSYTTVLIVIVVCIILVGFVINVLSE